MQENPNKSDLTRKAFEHAYIYDIQNEKHLLQKELILIHTEQTLLDQRIQMMKSFVNDLPSYDPQYSMILTTIKMDQIELDELAARKLSLLHKMESFS
jgi:hypothetical protein